MRKNYYFLAFFAGLTSGMLKAEQLPPLGSRLYYLDKQHPEDPAAIVPTHTNASASGVLFMRDPLPIGSPGQIGKSTAHTGVVVKKVSRMVFDQTSIQGRYLVPRVTFERPGLEVGRREEPIKVDYQKKIRESERELHDFEW